MNDGSSPTEEALNELGRCAKQLEHPSSTALFFGKKRELTFARNTKPIMPLADQFCQFVNKYDKDKNSPKLDRVRRLEKITCYFMVSLAA